MDKVGDVNLVYWCVDVCKYMHVQGNVCAYRCVRMSVLSN